VPNGRYLLGLDPQAGETDTYSEKLSYNTERLNRYTKDDKCGMIV